MKRKRLNMRFNKIAVLAACLVILSLTLLASVGGDEGNAKKSVTEQAAP